MTAALVVLLVGLFAALRNARSPVHSPEMLDDRHAAARAAFERLGCAGCHAMDELGAGMDRASIRDWATGTGAARAQLPPAVARRKSRAVSDPELEALIDYLAGERNW